MDVLTTVAFIVVFGAVGYIIGHWSAVLFFKVWDRFK